MTATARNPIDAVEWVDPSTLHANDYNPNRVFSIEMELLKRSILEDGWTQPVVATSEGEIVDGFHRWTLATIDDDIRAASGGKVPVVRIRDAASVADRKIATVRHNRARGQHGIIAMGEIVRDLQARGLDVDEICDRLGMEVEEVERLSELRPAPEQMGRESFGKGWVPAL